MKKIMSLLLVVCIIFCVSACKDENDVVDNNVVKEANETLKIHCFKHENLNPLSNTDESNARMLRLIFESLVQCDATQKPQPQLAESYSVSSDALVWTFKLKDGIKWHDGSAFTAADVVSSYKYVMDNTETSLYAVNVSNIDSVSSSASNMVEFKLKSPQANFANLMEVPIVKAGAFTPVGTGPYVYKETKNKIVYLVANEDWHGGELSVKNIHAKILPDEETATYAYVSKEIDVVSVNSSAELGKYSSNSDNVMVDYPSNSFTYISINTTQEPLSNRMFRKAMAHAINKEAINQEVLLSHGSVANTCMNTNWWVYNPGVTIYEYSKDKALNVLNDVQKNMKLSPVNLMVNADNSDKVKAAEMIREDFEKCGITLTIDYVDWATFTERVSTGNYQMYIGTVKYSSEINPSYVVQNPGIDLQNLFVSLQKQTTEDGIRAKYFEIQDKIATEIQIIPLYFDVSSLMYNKRIEGKFDPCRINIFNGVQNINLEG